MKTLSFKVGSGEDLSGDGRGRFVEEGGNEGEEVRPECGPYLHFEVWGLWLRVEG